MNERYGRFGSQRGNCALYGCAGAVVIGLIGVVAIGFAARAGFNKIKEQYTSTEQVELPVVDVSDSDRDATINRVDTWLESLRADEATEQLILTEKDVNVLIQHHEDLEAMSGNVYVTINDSEVVGEMSVPLENVPGLSGRYFNGSATFEVSLENNRLEIYAIAATVLGEPVPEEFMGGMRNENLAKEVQNNPDNRETIESIESLEISGGIITITPKGFGAESEEAPAESEAPAEV